jgi:FkbM family methyltransferase
MSVHGRPLKLPLSHTLPECLSKYPFYDRLPGRLSDYLFNKYGFIKCVDVGANIGDSIAALYKHDKDAFLAIEPNPKFNRFLKDNWGEKDTITILNFICSSESKADAYEISENHPGTASIVSNKNGVPMKTKSLDEIVEENPTFSDFNLLKIDTDGHDCEVIAGAKKIISHNLPAIIMECDTFSNTTYVDDYLKTFSFLRDVGYVSFILYDNFGHLLGKHDFDRLNHFKDLLFYRLTKEAYYYDILLMKGEDIEAFVQLERSYFVDKIPHETLQKTAAIAAEHCC